MRINNPEYYLNGRQDQFINDAVMDITTGEFPPKDNSTWIFPALHQVLLSVRNHKNTVVFSCNGFGKTFIASTVAVEFLVLNEDSIVITTAPTWNQVEMLLWGEIRARFNNSKVKLVRCPINQTSIKISEKWYAVGLSTNREEQFQGFHARKVLVIIDEASGVDRSIYKAISGIVNSDGAKLLAIGNPNSKDSRFYELTQLANYNVIQLSAFLHPNYIKGKEIREKISDDEWDKMTDLEKEDVMRPANIIHGALTFLGAENIASDYGRDSQVYQVRVRAEFPQEEDDVLIPYSWIQNHLKRETDKPDLSYECTGALDVARKGACETVLTLRYGGFILPQKCWKKKDGMETVDLVKLYTEPYNKPTYNTDADGMGGPVHDAAIREGLNSIEFHGGSTDGVDTTKFKNLRSWMYWRLRLRFEDKVRESILIDNDPELIAQLSTLKFHLDNKGVICVESKEDMMEKRKLKSPDRADSLMMSEWIYGAAKVENFHTGAKLTTHTDEEQDDDEYSNESEMEAFTDMDYGNSSDVNAGFDID